MTGIATIYNDSSDRTCSIQIILWNIEGVGEKKNRTIEEH